MNKLYFDILSIEEKEYILVVSETGLRFVGLYDGQDPLLEKVIEGYDLEKNTELVEEYKLSLLNYLQGNIKDLNLKFDLIGTDFQKEVWQELSRIEYGSAVSYKELSERLGRPSAVRAVANAVGKNPLLIFIPCHRVLGSNHTLTGFRSGLPLKKELLHLENIYYR